MAEPEDTLRNSPVDFDSAVAYALHPEMRRLLILYVVGALLVSVGFGSYYDTGSLGGLPELIGSLFGLAVGIVGAIFLFGGLVGAAFKLVADANLLAVNHE